MVRALARLPVLILLCSSAAAHVLQFWRQVFAPVEEDLEALHERELLVGDGLHSLTIEKSDRGALLLEQLVDLIECLLGGKHGDCLSPLARFAQRSLSRRS